MAAPAEFVVIDALEVGKANTPMLRLRLGPAGRMIEVGLTADGYRAARPGEAVTLPVETGRGGVRRVLIPARPLTPADLHQP